MKRQKKKQWSARTETNDLFSEADVVITDAEDPMAHVTAPGDYSLMDLVRGVTETIRVGPDGSRRVLQTVALGIEDRSATCTGTNLPAPFGPILVEVGAQFHPTRSRWPEGTHVEVTPGGLQFVLFVDGPTEKEMNNVGRGQIAVRLLTAPQTMMFLLQCGSSQWMDAPFSLHRAPEEMRVCPPDPGDGYGWMCTLILVDAGTGTVRSLRQLALSRRFSCAVLNAFEKQGSLLGDDAAHVREVAWFQRKSTSSLAGEAIDRFAQGDTAN